MELNLIMIWLLSLVTVVILGYVALFVWIARTISKMKD